ncbi:MAG: winged helix-turn-helix domain-containing protein [Acidobacteria bacterium]|nr:winged helix-turn-helix domain-containing protein [Acidobacteriota bacterium]
MTPKTFETLLVLVESGGRVVDKEELLQRIWPDTFVEEVSLAKKISLLRKTLGEDFTHHYIETIPRRGYRFVAQVHEVDQESKPQFLHQDVGEGVAINEEETGSGLQAPLRDTVSDADRGGSPSLAGRLAWSSAFLVIGLLAGLLIWRLAFRPPSGASAVNLRSIPLTSFQGRESQVAFSPDGNQVAFVWSGPQDENLDIYVKFIGDETPLRLTTHPAAETKPVWSPDGRYIVFLRQAAESSAFYQIPAIGGAERKLAEIFPYQVPSPGNSPYYSPDGKYLALPDKHSPADPMSIFMVSVETGEKRKLTSPIGGTVGDHYPAFSPDGKMLAFVRATSLSTDDLYFMPLSGGEPRRLTFDSVPVAGLAWTSDSREIVFSSRRSGSTIHLWRITAMGGKPERVDTVGKSVQSPAVSPQGHRLAYTQPLDDVNVWRIELDGTGRGRSQTELIASTFWDHGPDYSPDGEKIVFASDRSGGDGIWVCESDGSKPRLLIDCGPYVSGTPRWSPDGHWIAFDSRSNAPDTAGNPDIFIINADGGQPRRITMDPAEDIVPSWSHDGRWVYFSSMRSGSMQIWKAPVGGGRAVQVTEQGGFEGYESPDGKYLYYTKGRGIPGIWRVPTGGGKESLVTDHHQAGSWRYWRVINQGIYFATITKSGPLLEFFSFASGHVSEIARPARGPEKYIPGLAVSPNGRALLYAQMTHSGSDIMMVENFR